MSGHDEVLDRLLRGVDEFAESQIGELIDEASIEARSKVRAILVEAIAERLLDRAESELRSDSGLGWPSPARERIADFSAGQTTSAPSRRATPDLACDSDGQDQADGAGSDERTSSKRPELVHYVYGVVAEGLELDGLTGIDGIHPVDVISADGVAAIGSLVPVDEFGEESLGERINDLSWLEESARRHERILDEVRARTTLVPMRLCTIYRTDRAVREMLVREHEFLADALRRLEGRTEWGVKLFGLARSPLGAQSDSPSGPGDEAAGAGPGERYLIGKRSERRRRTDAKEAGHAFAQRAHELLAHLAVEAKINPLQPPELTQRDDVMLFNGVYLVDDSAVGELHALVESLQRESSVEGIELELTGPWPPYNFVNSPTEVGR
jgi:Gas vesicle synthesis protein GvpL/GvpF